MLDRQAILRTLVESWPQITPHSHGKARMVPHVVNPKFPTTAVIVPSIAHQSKTIVSDGEPHSLWILSVILLG